MTSCVEKVQLHRQGLFMFPSIVLRSNQNRSLSLGYCKLMSHTEDIPNYASLDPKLLQHGFFALIA